MADIKSVIEYQQADIECRKLLAGLEKGEDSLRMERARAKFNHAKQTCADCENKAERLTAQYNDSLAYYDENGKAADAIAAALKTETDEEKLAALRDSLMRVHDKFINFESKVGGLLRQSEEVVREYKDAQRVGKNAKEEYAESKVKVEALKASKKDEIAALNKKLGDAAKSVDAELMRAYARLSAEQIFPPFVELEGKNMCGYCRMELAQKDIGKLNESGYIECDHCHRMVYKR